MNTEQLQDEARILADANMGGRSEEFLMGAIRMAETFEALVENSEEQCLKLEHIRILMDFFNDYADYY